MNKEKVDRSETAIPCMIVFTKPLSLGGLPRDLFYVLILSGCVSVIFMKNIILSLIIGLTYELLRRIYSHDETLLAGLLRMSKKKYISY